ncbi:MAG TPA: hypothetical protein VHD31_01025 [Candidatus Paceibacterota bacterium]|nr:hypothetical protein [Candidatus Paceibacterota bacterium]
MHTRLITGAVGVLAGFFLFITPVFANTTNLSSDPSYGSQPLTFYCSPYKIGFQAGNHYVAQNGGPCVYTIPSTVLGTKTIATYKGVPGNSTFVAGDQIQGSPTLVQEDTNNFGSPLQDQNYFSVVYGYTTPADAALYDASFKNGSSTNVLPPGNNYALIQWKWGGKPASEYEPVLLVPDILNSWQTDTGLVIDPIFHIYQNLTDTFLANGYVLNQTFFPMPYNWQDSNILTAQALKNKIQDVKAACGCSHVDVVAHGTGGLIAEQYIGGTDYQNDVDQLVLMATPLGGVPAAYLAWEGGQISFGSPLSDGLAQVFLGASAKELGFLSVFDYIHNKPVLSFQEMLPTYDYLFDNDFNTYTYPTGYPRNTFIENLISNYGLNVFNRVRVNTILADDNTGQTTTLYTVAPSSQPPLWPEGQPTNTFTDTGDGMVPRASIENYVQPDHEFPVAHRALPTASQSYVFTLLNSKAPLPTVTTSYPVSCVLFLTTTSPADMQITDPNGNRLGKDLGGSGTFHEIGNSIYSGFAAAPEYGIVVNPINGIYQIRTQGSGTGNFSVNASDVCGQGVVATSTAPTQTTPGQLIGLQFTLATTSDSITIESLDINPPAVVINSPQQNHAYFNNATTSVSATFTDPENSPIATSTYRLNGVLINPAQPINFANLPLGTSTLVVSATDVFTNTGYATSSFSVVVAPPPADTGAPVITITAPQNNGSYLTTDSVVPAFTITDPEGSAIPTKTYKFNGASVNPAQALPFSSAPVGTSTFVISATDAAGNTGYATSSFKISAPQVSTGTGACAVALKTSGAGAITLAGSTQIKGTNCGVQVNSNSSGAVNISGSTKITSTKNCIVGTVSKSGSASISPNAVSCTAIADPFASHAKPAVGACTQTNYTLAQNNKATISPGVYCGGITVDGSAKLTLNPGIYILKGGDLSIAGSASVTGDGVSFFMTGSGAGLTLAGSGKLDISAPTSGTMAGFAIFLDPSNTNGTPLAATTLAGSGTLTLDGVVYLPRQQLNVAGSAKNTPSNFFAVVADTINISGSPTMTFTLPSGNSTIPVPAGL